MPNEIVVNQLEEIFAEVARLGGIQEITTIVPSLLVINAAPTGLTGYIIVKDNRDGDYIPVLKAPGVLYAANDLVNVLFVEGTEPIAFQQANQSSGSAVAVSKLISPDLTIDPVLSADNNGDSTAYSGDTVKGNVYANWFMSKLVDDDEGQLFTEYVLAVPTGWTEVDAASANSGTSEKYGFWYLRGTSVDTSYGYTKQTGIDIESLSSGYHASFLYGPILFKDGAFTADVDYYFGIYRDNSGIDTATFCRVNLNWDSAGVQWQMRGESKDGTTQTNGTFLIMSVPLSEPLYFRCVVRNHTTPGSRRIRLYAGTSPEPSAQTLLQENVFSVTWGTVFWRFNQARGAGTADKLFIGKTDFLGNVN